MCSQRQGRICLVVVRPVAGPEGPVEQQCSNRMTGYCLWACWHLAVLQAHWRPPAQTRDSGRTGFHAVQFSKTACHVGTWLTLDTNMAPEAGAFSRRSPQMTETRILRSVTARLPAFWMTASGQSPCWDFTDYADYRAVSRARTPLVFMPESDKSGQPWGLEKYTRRLPAVNLISCRL